MANFFSPEETYSFIDAETGESVTVRLEDVQECVPRYSDLTYYVVMLKNAKTFYLLKAANGLELEMLLKRLED